MRRRDKLKNIVMANLLAEQRHLESKGVLKEEDFKRVSASELYPHPSDVVNIDFPIIIKSKQDWTNIVGDLIGVGFKWNDGSEITHEDIVDIDGGNKYPYKVHIADKGRKTIGVSPVDRRQMGGNPLGGGKYDKPEYNENVNESGIKKNRKCIKITESQRSLLKSKGLLKEDSDTYFETLSATLDHVREMAKEMGYELDEDAVHFQFGTGGIPYGQTKSATIPLLKDGEPIMGKSGKPLNRAIRVSIYRMDSGRYELTAYKTF